MGSSLTVDRGPTTDHHPPSTVYDFAGFAVSSASRTRASAATA
jgi:hypothetical protein